MVKRRIVYLLSHKRDKRTLFQMREVVLGSLSGGGKDGWVTGLPGSCTFTRSEKGLVNSRQRSGPSKTRVCIDWCPINRPIQRWRVNMTLDIPRTYTRLQSNKQNIFYGVL